MRKKVLVVGAGYAGVETALRLSKKKKKTDIEITVIDKNDYHTLLTELHEVAGNRIPEEGVRIPLQRVFQYSSVNYRTDDIKTFDFDNNRLKSETMTYDYDYLVLAMGSKPNFYCIEGLEENSFTLWSYDDAVRIREHVKKCFLLASQESDEAKRRQLMTFAVGGAGFTGVEMIGELAHWTKQLCKQYGLDKKDLRLLIIDMLPRILCTLSEKNAAKAFRYMTKKLGIEIILKASIDKVGPEGFMAGQQYISTKTLIWCAGVCAVDEVDYMEYEKLGGAKRIEVDQFCRTEHCNVYCVGDMTGLLGADGKPYPAMVETAIQRDIRGEEQEEVKVVSHGVMVSVGNYFAVSDIMGRELPSWLSIIMKFIVNIHYLWEINGFAGVARYLYHETLERRQRKLLLEKHWSTRVQAWWLMPLRMFLGGIWIYEAVAKIIQGWLQTPKLEAFMGATLEMTKYADRVKDYFHLNLGILKFGFYAEKIKVAADAVSSASTAGDGGATLGYTLGETFFKIDFPLMNSFVKATILSSEGAQMFFQYFIIFSEILIGLAFLAGIMTFVVSVISLFLNFNFMTTTGVYSQKWWMIFAAIAMLAGAGRAFGFDYYFIPYLNNIWERLWKKRKFNLFFKGGIDRHERD
jgi:NADH dehydrogenase